MKKGPACKNLFYSWFNRIIGLIFSFLHIEFSHLHGIAKTIGDMAYYGAIGLIVLALLFLSNQFLGSIPVIAPLTKIFRRLMAKFKIDR